MFLIPNGILDPSHFNNLVFAKKKKKAKNYLSYYTPLLLNSRHALLIFTLLYAIMNSDINPSRPKKKAKKLDF